MIKQQDLKIAGAEQGEDYNNEVIIWGIPTSLGAGTGRLGAEKGPDKIRNSSHIWNTVRTSQGYDFGNLNKVTDLGNVDFSASRSQDINEYIFDQVPWSDHQHLLITLGGDHSITYPVIKAKVSKNSVKPNLIYLDAHPDAVNQVKGNYYSHACVLRRLIDEDLIGSVLFIGMRIPEKEEIEYFVNGYTIGEIPDYQ
ncbi:MAG: arginase family protein, partial [Spirochaetes bacterium]|nr:arginase family protein [Spirochaetota bacterium]